MTTPTGARCCTGFGALLVIVGNAIMATITVFIFVHPCLNHLPAAAQADVRG
ncbi:MAG: hypothetical protein ACTMKZ_00640 [Brevibacterium aurantiacum]|uniref:hypothetical protein n=1 Tax=Actinomycetes TaxID=1760 RepID=UPI0013FE3493|nr:MULTISPECIES: hypothetical protein [Actinomycetes]MDN5718757.1 hypothetical protein [Corynebacterium sp.]MDN6323851.1 hypothetical protein [Corynebacterium sp.]MDN6327929.1 hypothetical protein [Brachybacterium sp.]